MDTSTRTLLRVQIEDAIYADQAFMTLMGRLTLNQGGAFIETNALIAKNIECLSQIPNTLDITSTNRRSGLSNAMDVAYLQKPDISKGGSHY
jgi:hypothetical protein